MKYNKETASAEFKKARNLLDSGKYSESIKIFSELVSDAEDSKDEDKEAEIRWNTALCNRGVGKCRMAIETKDKRLYEDGLSDYRKVCDSVDVKERPYLTASVNLRTGEEGLKFFDGAGNIEKPNFSASE